MGPAWTELLTHTSSLKVHLTFDHWIEFGGFNLSDIAEWCAAIAGTPRKHHYYYHYKIKVFSHFRLILPDIAYWYDESQETFLSMCKVQFWLTCQWMIPVNSLPQDHFLWFFRLWMPMIESAQQCFLLIGDKIINYACFESLNLKLAVLEVEIRALGSTLQFSTSVEP